MRYRKPKKRVSAAVSIDQDVYERVQRERITPCDTNFSRYVRELIRADLRSPMEMREWLTQAEEA